MSSWYEDVRTLAGLGRRVATVSTGGLLDVERARAYDRGKPGQQSRPILRYPAMVS